MTPIEPLNKEVLSFDSEFSAISLNPPKSPAIIKNEAITCAEVVTGAEMGGVGVGIRPPSVKPSPNVIPSPICAVVVWIVDTSTAMRSVISSI